MTSKSSRVSIYIDGPNLFHTGDEIGCRIDYVYKFIPFCLQHRSLVEANFYNTTNGSRGLQSFHRKLVSAGYNVKLYKLRGRPHEKRVDTQIVADALYDAFQKKFDIAIICSGDGDMLPAVEYLMKMRKQVEIMAFWHGFSWDLRTSGAKIIDLSRNIRKIIR